MFVVRKSLVIRSVFNRLCIESRSDFNCADAIFGRAWSGAHNVVLTGYQDRLDRRDVQFGFNRMEQRKLSWRYYVCRCCRRAQAEEAISIASNRKSSAPICRQTRCKIWKRPPRGNGPVTLTVQVIIPGSGRSVVRHVSFVRPMRTCARHFRWPEPLETYRSESGLASSRCPAARVSAAAHVNDVARTTLTMPVTQFQQKGFPSTGISSK